MIIWNPWHGCHKVSEGCQHCYMYFLDGKRGIDTSKVYRTENFNLPVQRRRDGRFKLPSGMQLYVGLSTDFFVEEADERLPILLDIPAKHRGFMAAPFIGEVDAEKYLATGQFEEVLCGGENYDGARPCHYEWVKKLSDQCRKYDVTFDFIETGTVFVKEGKTYRIPDKRTQSLQAYKSGLSYKGKDIDFNITNPEPGFFDPSPLRGGWEGSYTPFFREHCETCGSRMTCNGCSNCGNCDIE